MHMDDKKKHVALIIGSHVSERLLYKLRICQVIKKKLFTQLFKKVA